MGNDTMKEAMKELAKDAYADAGKPIVKPAGELVGLVPRAIKAALSPLEKWILQKEYNVEETKKLLEEKLKNIPPEQIQPPEPYIAVPALQYISYCLDNNELRNMYANLLANSMNSVVKDGVHPGFVEIIKQISPDEAKILNYFSVEKSIPTISLKSVNDSGGYTIIMNVFSNIGKLVQCEKPFDISVYFDNLIRLGLLESGTMIHFTDQKKYEPLKNHPYIKETIDNIKLPEGKKIDFDESIMTLTDFGDAFCKICLDEDQPLVIYPEKFEENGE